MERQRPINGRVILFKEEESETWHGNMTLFTCDVIPRQQRRLVPENSMSERILNDNSVMPNCNIPGVAYEGQVLMGLLREDSMLLAKYITTLISGPSQDISLKSP